MVCAAQRPLAAENPDKHPMMWATAQALVTLPVSLIGYAATCLWLSIQNPMFTLPFGPHPALFIGLMIAIAVLCSWVGALCWNIASQKLPTVILGPLIVFETLAGLLYTFILRRNPAIPDVKRHCAPGGGRGYCRESETGKSDRRSGHGTLISSRLNYTHPERVIASP